MATSSRRCWLRTTTARVVRQSRNSDRPPATNSSPRSERRLYGAHSAARQTSAAGDSRNDRHRLAVANLGVEAVQEADVVVGHEDVDEAPQAVFVEQSLHESRMGA